MLFDLFRVLLSSLLKVNTDKAVQYDNSILINELFSLVPSKPTYA